MLLRVCACVACSTSISVVYALIFACSYGVVYSGQWRGSEVAIKVVKNYTESDLTAFMAEAEMMKSMRPHKHVVLLQGVCLHESSIMIVTEFCQGMLK